MDFTRDGYHRNHTAASGNGSRHRHRDEAGDIRAAVNQQRSVGSSSGPAGAAAVTRTPAGTSREGASHRETRRVSALLGAL